MYEGQLREEITIQSNAILTIERKKERLVDPGDSGEFYIMCIAYFVCNLLSHNNNISIIIIN
jgi:hypothetical protein